jgi:hypothetical protein
VRISTDEKNIRDDIEGQGTDKVTASQIKVFGLSSSGSPGK